ncbi:hypothetical protein [Sorangium sp. So ce1000]|uniref:hypothetical protein n=1 Tax=Sorangium sp. So ce1000 TaxID=3133325 RepID=UPI003F62C660
MTRSILSGLLGLLSVVAMASLPSACESGGVGDPCLPEDEYDPQFAGFKVTEENIESRSFQCQTRICLVNHFQGRVSCPLGQEAPALCKYGDDAACGGNKEACVLSGAVEPPNCAGKQDCKCQSDDDCYGEGWKCNPSGMCEAYVCRPTKANSKEFLECQEPTTEFSEDNAKRPCCVPGTQDPIAAPVCGQCASNSNRNAQQAVYCSCRCGVADGEPDDPNFNFCDCPQGFTCSEIRPNVGLGDPNITGKYCIKQGTQFENEGACGNVQGRTNSDQCEGF